MITWYPVHPTNMNFTNRLINSDNKGRASMLVERMMRKEGETQTGKVGVRLGRGFWLEELDLIECKRMSGKPMKMTRMVYRK